MRMFVTTLQIMLLGFIGVCLIVIGTFIFSGNNFPEQRIKRPVIIMQHK